MKDHAPTGPVCKACGQMLMTTRDGDLCGCRARPRDPAAVAVRAMRAVMELGRQDRSGVYMLRRR